jgi:hypothetical protein
MTKSDTLIASGTYIGATADELTSKTGSDKVAAGVSQKVLFQHRGEISLFPDRLVLGGWLDGDDLVLGQQDITEAQARFTDLYGRFIGGLFNAGKPLILTVPAIDELYLLIDRKEIMETTDDRRWAKLLADWLSLDR